MTSPKGETDHEDTMTRRYETRTAATMTPDQAVAEAHAAQIAAASYDDDPDPQVIAHEQLQRRLHTVARYAPLVRVAWWLLDLQLIPPVPLDHELQPAADPLTSTDAIIEHWQTHPDHQVGIATGPHPLRPWSYVAVEVDLFAHWQEWLKDAAKATTTVPDLGGFASVTGHEAEVGPPTTQTRYRDTGSFSRLTWSPPPLPSMKRYPMDAAGGGLVKEMKRRNEGRGGWVLLVVPDPDRKVNIRKARRLAPGIKVLPTGTTVLPWDGSRTQDGWSLTVQAAAHSQGGLAPSPNDPIRPWLIDLLTD